MLEWHANWDVFSYRSGKNDLSGTVVFRRTGGGEIFVPDSVDNTRGDYSQGLKLTSVKSGAWPGALDPIGDGGKAWADDPTATHPAPKAEMEICRRRNYANVGWALESRAETVESRSTKDAEQFARVWRERDGEAGR